MAFPSGARVLPGKGASRFQVVNRFGEEIGTADKKGAAKQIAREWHPTCWDFISHCEFFFAED